MNRALIYGFSLFLLAVNALLSPSITNASDETTQRAAMIREIEADARRTASYINSRALDERVLTVMGRVPRHEFVPSNQRRYAYQNRPLPIGQGQTISQPYIVALMTDLIAPKPHHRVLEVGTGSGYQAAVLSRLTAWVFSVEIIPELANEASERLSRLAYGNITTRVGDGYHGWAEKGPFDVIVVTAAADHIPPPLIRQLKPGGRMVIPVGGRFTTQQLLLITKDNAGETRVRQILPVVFVPLTGRH